MRPRPLHVRASARATRTAGARRPPPRARLALVAGVALALWSGLAVPGNAAPPVDAPGASTPPKTDVGRAAALPAPTELARSPAPLRVAPPPPADARRAGLPTGRATLRFAMIVLGATVSRPIVELGPVTTLDDGRRARTLKLVASTSGLVGQLYSVDNRYLAILDADTLEPWRTQMRRRTPDGDTALELSWRRGSRRVDVATAKDGEKSRHAKSVELGTADMISWIVQLQQLGLATGDRAVLPMYSGSYHLNVVAEAAATETVVVPAGTFRATRTEVRFERWRPSPALEGGAAPDEPAKLYDEATVWFADDRWRTPIKLTLNIESLGDLELALDHSSVGER